jgi:ketosteroid isomerase-like protein
MDEQTGEAGFEGTTAESRAAFVSALKRGDAALAARAYADDARLLAPSAELIEGRQAIEGFWRAGLEAGISDVQLEPFALERERGLAYEIGHYVLKLEPAEGGSVVDRGKYLLVHEQADGSWHWAVKVFNPDAPAAKVHRTLRSEHRVHGNEGGTTRREQR